MRSPSKQSSRAKRHLPDIGLAGGDANVHNELERQLNQHVAQAQAIYLLADAVARTGIEEIYGKALDAIEVALKIDRVSLLLFDPDGVMRFKAWRGLSDEYRAAVEGHSPWTQGTKDPEPITVNDIQIEPGYEKLRPVITREGIRALAFVPLVSHGVLVGKFMLYYSAPHDFSSEEVRLAQTVASHIAFAISRKESEEALREAEERYRGIFENAVFGAYQTTPDGRFLTANDALARILGYDSSADLIASITDIGRQIHVDPERRAEFAQILEEAGAVHNFEAQAYCKDGSIIWISLSARALRGEDGVLDGYEGILEDVSPRVRVEQALTESEFRYRTIFDSAGVSLWEEDFSVAWQMLEDLRRRGVRNLRKYFRDHPEFVDEAIAAVNVLDVNEHSVRLFGAKDKTELMNSLTNIFLPETREAFQEELLVLSSGGRFLESETVVATLDGKPLHVLFSISFPEEPSLLNHVMVSLTDITERKLVEQRQQFLAEAGAILASSLDHETTLSSVAQLCVPDLADWCVIDVRNEDGSFNRVAAVHRDPEKVEFARRMQERYPPDYESGIVSQVVKTGKPVLYADVPEEVLVKSARDADHLRFVKELDVKSGIMVPLTARGRTLGILTLLISESERRYGERELKLAEELAQQAGLALDNARLYHAAEDARDLAEASRRRQAFVAEASSILASSLDYQTTLARVADFCVPELADWCTIDIAGEGGSLDHVAIVHRDPEKMEIGQELRERYPTNYEGGIAKAVVGSGKSFFWPELPEAVLEEAAQNEEHLALLRQLGLKSAAVVPLTAREKTFGMLTLVMAESGRRYSDEDFAVAQEVAWRAAIAIDNAQLYSAEHASRRQAEEAQRRSWFLAEANAVLSSSLDFEATLSRVASLAVPWLADCCVAHIFPGEGGEARSAVAHVDASKEALVKELHARYAPRPNEPHPLMEMIQSQTAVLMEDISESALEEIIQDERHREILRQLNFKSYMAAPLIARGRLFGALTFATSNPTRRYSRQDLSPAEELARRAALALDNARLYEDSQRTQDALRAALEAKDEFLGVMSHELRTPITAIYGGARVLRSRAGRLDEESKNRMMDDIEQESERLFRMVENLLVLSRLELGQEVSTEPVLVQRLIAKLTAAFTQRRPGRPIEVNVSEQLEPVFAEPHYLEQILRNLLSNADKYSPSESPIEVEARAREGEVDISVLDRGAGIAPEEIDLIFDRFYRSDRTATQAAGIGMGLTVCKRLAEAQAGRIWARPREGGGLQVGITLPICKEE